MTSRTKWPSAQHLQRAADLTREPDPNLDPEREHYTAPLGEWLDKAANELAWLAPYREHEGGYGPWRAATRAAHGVLGLPDADSCAVCHPERRTPAPRPAVQRADRIVAYTPAAGRPGNGLHCRRCTPTPRGDIWTPVTAEELEDGGMCTTCGADVLID